MAILTSRMVAALAAARTAGALGLRYTESGWVDDSEPEPRSLHSFSTVSALIERGDLSRQRGLTAEGARCFVTPRGKASLADAGVTPNRRPAI